MYDITIDGPTAIVIRDAIRIAIERWSGGHPSEQRRLHYLESEFNKIVLDHTWTHDA